MGIAYARMKKMEKKKTKDLFKKLHRTQLKLNTHKRIEKEESSPLNENENIPSNIILEELNQNSNIDPHARRYSDATYAFSVKIHQTSPSIYNMIREELAFPSAQSLYNKYSSVINEARDELLDLNHLNSILHTWRNSNKIKYDRHINVALSVDAISFKPRISIDPTGVVKGLTESLIISAEEFQEMKKDKQNFAAFISSHFGDAITSAFVYQIQPLNGCYNNVLAYIEPAANGKADEKQIESLQQIRDISGGCKVNVKVMTFDGDNAYCSLHEEYFNSWYNKIGYSEHVADHCTTRRLRIVGDPLHILKRVRYRLLKNDNIAVGFTNDDPVIDLELIKEQLCHLLPAVVFSNEGYTKMHDSLPGQLFSAESLKILCLKNNKEAVAYFIPWTLILMALNNYSLEDYQAYDLMEIAFFYLYFYIDVIESNKDEIRQTMAEKKSISKKLLMFPLDMSKEILNSLHAFLMLAITEDSLYIDNCTTRPLEHTFGITRMKAKYTQRYDKIISGLTNLNFNKFLDDSQSVISGRIEKFGRRISVDLQNKQQTFSESNRIIGLALTSLFNNPGAVLLKNREHIIEQFLYEFLNDDDIISSDNSCTCLTINSLLLGTQNSARIKESLHSRCKIENIVHLECKIKEHPEIRKDSNHIQKQLEEMFLTRLKMSELVKILETVGLSLDRDERTSRKKIMKKLTENWEKYKNSIADIAQKAKLLAQYD